MNRLYKWNSQYIINIIKTTISKQYSTFGVKNQVMPIHESNLLRPAAGFGGREKRS